MLKELLTPDQIKLLYRGNFTVPQAALYLAIGEQKIDWLIKQGEIGVVLIDGHRYVSRAECDRFLIEHTKRVSKTKETNLNLRLKKCAYR